VNERKIIRLQAARAIYRDGLLLFDDPAQAPSGATEVLVTYAEEFPETERDYRVGALAALRGRGKGEQLVKRLLQARREDREQDDRDRRSVRP
jgi:hypothetical protein